MSCRWTEGHRELGLISSRKLGIGNVTVRVIMREDRARGTKYFLEDAWALNVSANARSVSRADVPKPGMPIQGLSDHLVMAGTSGGLKRRTHIEAPE